MRASLAACLGASSLSPAPSQGVDAVSQGELCTATSKVAALEAQQAARAVEHVQLRRQLYAARQAVDPHIIQALPPPAQLRAHGANPVALSSLTTHHQLASRSTKYTKRLLMLSPSSFPFLHPHPSPPSSPIRHSAFTSIEMHLLTPALFLCQLR